MDSLKNNDSTAHKDTQDRSSRNLDALSLWKEGSNSQLFKDKTDAAQSQGSGNQNSLEFNSPWNKEQLDHHYAHHKHHKHAQSSEAQNSAGNGSSAGSDTNGASAPQAKGSSEVQPAQNVGNSQVATAQNVGNSQLAAAQNLGNSQLTTAQIVGNSQLASVAPASGTSTDTTSAGAAATTNQPPDHLVIVNLENTSAKDIIGNSNAPFMNQLIQDGRLYTNSTGMPGSYKNYVAQLAGSTLGTGGDFTGNLPGQTIADQLIAQGQAQGKTADQMVGFYAEGSNQVPRHEPWLGFNSLKNMGQDFSQFGANGFNNLPEVSFVTPNLLDDAHGTGSQSRQQLISQSDQWLQKNVSPLVNYAMNPNNHTDVLFTFDEPNLGSSANTPIYTALVGAGVQPGTTDSTPITQASIAHGIEQAYGLPFLGDSTTTAPPIKFGEHTGITGAPPPVPGDNGGSPSPGSGDGGTTSGNGSTTGGDGSSGNTGGGSSGGSTSGGDGSSGGSRSHGRHHRHHHHHDAESDNDGDDHRGGSSSGGGDATGGSSSGTGDTTGGSSSGTGDTTGGSSSGTGDTTGGSSSGTGDTTGGSSSGTGDTTGGSSSGTGDTTGGGTPTTGDTAPPAGSTAITGLDNASNERPDIKASDIGGSGNVQSINAAQAGANSVRFTMSGGAWGDGLWLTSIKTPLTQQNKNFTMQLNDSFTLSASDLKNDHEIEKDIVGPWGVAGTQINPQTGEIDYWNAASSHWVNVGNLGPLQANKTYDLQLGVQTNGNPDSGTYTFTNYSLNGQNLNASQSTFNDKNLGWAPGIYIQTQLDLPNAPSGTVAGMTESGQTLYVA